MDLHATNVVKCVMSTRAMRMRFAEHSATSIAVRVSGGRDLSRVAPPELPTLSPFTPSPWTHESLRRRTAASQNLQNRPPAHRHRRTNGQPNPKTRILNQCGQRRAWHALSASVRELTRTGNLPDSKSRSSRRIPRGSRSRPLSLAFSTRRAKDTNSRDPYILSGRFPNCPGDSPSVREIPQCRTQG